MNKLNIVDASAILAYLQGEKGADIVDAALDEWPSCVTTVNYCEVLGKLLEKGMPEAEAQAAMDELGLQVIDFDVALARRAAALRPRTMTIGASLGDRACLALAEQTAQSPVTPVVYTAEQSWAKLKLGFKIVQIRPGKTGQ